MKTFLIHGSDGYTGQLIAELAVREGLKPILAGRAAPRLQTRTGYSFAAQTTVEIMKRILSCDYKTCFQTPSLVYGPDFVLQFDGAKRTDE